MSPAPPSREQRFRQLYDQLRPPLLRFVHRRTRPETVEDVVAEVFLVLWRRLEEVPVAADDARAWAYGVTRHVLLNQWRGQGRRRDLGLRLMAEDDVRADTAGDHVEELLTRLDVARAWARLPEVHQEVLGLVLLDDLDASAAAGVLGISPVAFRLRLSRARRALRAHLDHQPRTAPPTRSTTVRSTP